MPPSTKPPIAAVVLTDLSFAWPDGELALDHINGTFGTGRTGLVGRNGSGKSTLLRLIAGCLQPSSGSVAVNGVVDYLPQHLTLDVKRTLADLLGVGEVVAAVRAISAGVVDDYLFDVVGDQWALEERAVAALAAAGLPDDLDREVGSLSGGEAVLAAVVGLQLRRADVALLDEPTNNLDANARERLYGLLRRWRGALVVVSHDRTLLELMDQTAELRAGSLTTFGGTFSEFESSLAIEQAAALRGVRDAQAALRRERAERIKAAERIAHSERRGRRDVADARYPTIALNNRRNSAEKSQGARRGQAAAAEDAARAALEAAQRSVREDDTIIVDLPDPAVAPGRRLAVLRGSDGREFVIQGPERVALVGPNGCGKTTLLNRLVGGEGLATDRVGYLPQRLTTLADDLVVLDAVRASAPSVPPGVLRNRLARFLLRGETVYRTVGSLSGGERFRVALAQLLLAEPPAQLLVLDEPTNNLDLASTDQLISALSSYRGALLVVSHDRAFLERLGIDLVLRLAPNGVITATDWTGANTMNG